MGNTDTNNINVATENGVFNPFPGLRPFTIEESHLFFGREGQSDEVLKLLSSNRFVGVIGTSGSGKSSLMYCGVVPILYGGFIAEAGSDWRIVTTRPGGGPIGNLAEALVKSEGKDISPDELLLQKSLTTAVLNSSSLGLVDAVKGLNTKKKENVLILVDQFEELFRFKKTGKETKYIDETIAFVKLLLQAISQTDVPIYMVLTMRSDFIGECAQFPELTEMINDSHYLIPQMTREDLRQAVIGPVSVGGGQISSHLVQQLLNDIGDNPDQLPILQHSLMRTWNHWIANNDGSEPMSMDNYEAIGTMEMALSQHANEAFDELTEKQKIICQAVFRTLTEKGNDNRGIRHPTALHEIAAIAKADEKDIIPIIDTFRKTGRTFLVPSIENTPVIQSDTIVDISHESLMRIWNKLIVWVDDEGYAVQMYMRLSEAAMMFQMGNIGLWRPPDLQLALTWREKTQPSLAWATRHDPAFERAMEYLNASEKSYVADEENKVKLQKAQLRRSRIFAIFLGSATIISLLFLVYSFVQQAKAEKQEALALEQSVIAQENAEEAKRQQVIADQKSIEAEEAAKEAALSAEEAKKQALIAEQKSTEAERSANNARKQTKIADQKSIEAAKSAEEAKASAALADIEKGKAEEASKNAYDLRLLSISQSMAVKSRQLHKDTNEKALVAYQAYLFNEDYGGETHNPDVYDGLYYTLKQLNNPDYNSLEGHDDAIRSLQFTPDGETLFTTGSDGRIFKWDMSTPERKKVQIAKNGSVNRALAISANNKWLACGSVKSEIQLYDIKKPDSDPITLKGHEGEIWDLVFLSDDNKLVSCAGDGTIFMWDISTQQYTVIAKSQSIIKSITLSPNGNIIAGGLENGKIVLWDIANNNTSRILAEEENAIIHVVTFSNEGSILAFGDQNGNIKIWDINENKMIQQFEGQTARINDIKFSPDDSQIAAASFDGSVNIWDTRNYNLQPIVLNDHTSWVQTIAFSPDGQKLIAGCRDNLIRVWPTNTKKMAEQICPKISRNMSSEEWNRFVAKDIPFENTCKDIVEPTKNKK